MIIEEPITPQDSKKSLLWQCLIYSWLIGFLTYGYHYTSSNFAFDGFVGSDLREDTISKIQFGRFSQILNYYFRGFVAAPWIIGILAMTWTALSTFFIAQLFDLKNKMSLIIINALLITAPTFAASHNIYFHEVDNFALAFLFAVLCVYLYSKRRFYGSILVALVCFVLSVSTYTPYLSVIPTLFLLVLIQDIFSKEMPRFLFVKLAKFSLFCITGGLIYLGIYKLIFFIGNIQPVESYNSVHSILSGNPVEYVISLLKGFVFSYFVLLVRIIHPGAFNSGLIGLLFIVLSLLAAFSLVRICFLLKLSKLQLGLLASALLLLVPSIFLARILAPNVSHSATQYPELLIFFVFLFFATYYERLRKKSFPSVDRLGVSSYKIIITILFAGLFANWIFANRLFYQRELIATTTHSFYTRLVHEIEKNEHYEPLKTPVVFIGSIQSSPYLLKREPFGECQFDFFHNGPTTIEYERVPNIARYLRHHLGSSLIVKHVIENNDEVPASCKDLPLYPKDGCMKMLDGTLYVNMSVIEDFKR